MPEFEPTRIVPAGTPEGEATGVYNPLDTASELVRVLDRYLADMQAGKAPDKDRLLAEHPALARQLEDCLAGIEFVHRAARPMAGTPTQLGDFRIVREVGRGGMGVVYEAEQVSLKRKVALKVLRFGVTTDAEVMQRFQREAETVAHLHHTNIVPIHAVGCEQGVHYYAMQFIEGRSLAAVAEELQSTKESLAAEAAAPRETKEKTGLNHFHELVGWMLQAAEALSHAHQRNVIHRDVKPANLILDPEGTVWLTDFGLARRADEVTMTAAGVVMGTPRYMSPEQAAAAKQPIDHRTDIYSLGATFYELATGKPVFDSQTPQGVITQILSVEPVAPRILQGTLPRDLETIILKCLAKEPAKRYQQARELADDLRAYLENRPIRARRTSLLERAVRWARKHRRSTAISAVSAIVSLVLIAASFVGWNAYKESLLGRLVLTTDGPSLVAEVLNDQDELVVPSFPVPNPQPVVVPAGSYRVRLSGSGTLSEIWEIDVERGQLNSYPVKLLDRVLATPLEIRDKEAPELIALNGHTHLFHRGERGWRLTRGAELTSRWANDLGRYPEKPEETPYPRSLVSGAWLDLLQVSNDWQGHGTATTPGLACPATDVDGDGQDDLILASRVSPSLLAVSATSGSVLWWYRAAPNSPENHDAVSDPIDPKTSSEDAGIIGQPIVVDRGGEPTVMTMTVSFASHLFTKSGKEFRTDRAFYVEAVTARTGKQVWRTVFTLPDLPGLNSSELVKYFPNRLEVAEFDQRRTLLLHVNTKVLGFDLQTGKELWPARDLGGRPMQAVRFSDLDGDRRPEALTLSIKDHNTQEVLLKAIALQTGAVLWEKTFHPTDRVDSYHIPGPELTWVYDLNGDGKAEVVAPARDDWSHGGKHWFGIEVLNGATGAVLWQRRLWTSRNHFAAGGGSSGSIRILTGPDLNGDGHVELFATSMVAEIGGDRHFLQVDALSGQDGAVLWRRDFAAGHSLYGRQSQMLWWQVAEDGWPQLVVPTDKGESEQSATYLFSASTGRITSILPEVANPQVADFNGDGLPDLYHLAGSQGTRRLTVLKGLPDRDWRRPGDWKAGRDYDGDGLVDFLKFQSQGFMPTSLIAYSGRERRVLWKTEIQRVDATPDFLTSADVDGDGTFDVVALDTFSTERGNTNTITALSGKNGKTLWKGTDLGQHMSSGGSSGGGASSNYSYPLLDQYDLDGDGRPEILIAASIGNNGNTISLGAVSNTDGSLLWKIPILNAAYTGGSLVDRNLWHDLNGDGVLDIVLWVPKSVNDQGVSIGAELRAFSGRDGKPLWENAGQLEHAWFLWPRTAIADLDGDGQPEVVLTTNDGKGLNQKTGGFPCELVVLDGRNGRRKWSWPWSSDILDLWPPLLVNMEGDGQRPICMGIRTRAGTESGSYIIVIDPLGKIRQKLPMGWISSTQAWAALDVDRDGKEELLYTNESQLQAYSGSGQRAIWKWPLTSFGFRFDEFRMGRKDQPDTLVAWMDRTAYGLNPATGTPRWRCEVPKQDTYQLIATVNYSESLADLPQVVSVGAETKSTIVQRALPTDAAGAYQFPPVEPVTFPEFSEPTQFQPLPWAYRRLIGVPELLTFLIFFGSLCTWTIRRKWRWVQVYLVLYCLATVGIGTIILRFLADPLEAGDRYSWDGWYWILYIGGGVLGALTFFTACVWIPVNLLRRLLCRKP